MGRRVSSGVVGGTGLGSLSVVSATISSTVADGDITLEPNGTGSVLVEADLFLHDQGDLQFGDADSSNYVAIQAPASVASNYTLTLPSAVSGVSGYALTSDTNGTLSWSAAGAALTDNNSDSGTNYLVFTTQTSGFLTTSRVATTTRPLSYQPSTGTLAATIFSGPATQVVLTADDSTNATNYPVFVNTATGDAAIRTDTGYTYNPSTGELTAVILTASSDMAVKEDIVTITDALNKVKRLRGVSYVRKENKIAEIGVLAQEVEKVVPSIVRGNEGNKSVAYGNLVALLIEAIKEQQSQIDELKEGAA